MLLIAHATGFHGRAYAPFAEHLRGFRVAAPDLRGHGDATPPADLDFKWEGLADDIEAVVDHLDARGRLFAFGHSMGAAVSLLAETRRPGTFVAIYGFEPIVYPPRALHDSDRRDRFQEGTKKRRRHFASKAEAIANYSEKAPFSGFTPASLDAYLDHGFHFAADGSLTLKMDPHNEARMYSM
ncbi:MAG: alpha/beta fold hydrolase, partial [Thermoanaerobaculia bacterium]|nr:alpha/beta fold hydrolase [Thermoanaerobaculia bacterium]